jgi:erythritol transport system substrate-binding protein
VSRFTSGIVALALMFLLMACGCSRRDASKRLVVVIVPSQDNPFFKAEADAAAVRAVALGYRVRVDSHDDDAYRQDNLIDAAIASDASAIILDNAGADSSVAAIRRATQAGIPCFLIDREINVAGIAKAEIVADNHQGSRIVAEEFARALGSAKANYVELLGRESDTNAQVRTTGFHSVLDKLPHLTRVAAQSANWSQAEAFQKTETILQAHPDIAGIIAGNDTMALGALAAVKSSGKKGIVIAGFDGSPDAVAAVRSGELLTTALQPAVLIARLAVDQADMYLKTKKLDKPELQIIPCDLVTRGNAADFRDFEKVR